MTTAPDTLIAANMTERELQNNVVAMARALGWMPYHTFDSRRSEPGYPDLTLVHRDMGRVLWAELKTMKGRVSPAQMDWLSALYDVALDRGLEVYTWRPDDWLSGSIERVLRGAR